jgi:hypothetical protein
MSFRRTKSITEEDEVFGLPNLTFTKNLNLKTIGRNENKTSFNNSFVKNLKKNYPINNEYEDSFITSEGANV